MARGAVQFEIEHWEAHLWHTLCGVWADRRCRVCGIKDAGRGVREQWEQKPKLRARALSDFG